ncbi:MAG: hypothetical protein AAF570_06695 [Bacteroidota bacterium]
MTTVLNLQKLFAQGNGSDPCKSVVSFAGDEEGEGGTKPCTSLVSFDGDDK